MRKTWSPAGPLRRALTGIATTVVEGPVGTSTRTEAPGAGAWLWIRARTSALRVAGSTRASTATIRAVIGRGSSAANTATGSPGCSSAATAWATVKSTLAAASIPCSVVSSVPSFRYCPGWTSEIPTRAVNGARIVLRAMTVPTDVVVGRYCRARATARLTDSTGSGWLAAAASALRAEACFQATRLLAVKTSVPNSNADPTQPRLFMTKGLRICRISLCCLQKVKRGSATRRLGEPQIDMHHPCVLVSGRSQLRDSFMTTRAHSAVMNYLAEGFPEGVDSGLRRTTILRPQPCSHDAGGAMRYLCLIYSDDSQWSKMPKADQDKWLAEYREFGEDLQRSGH